MRMVQGPLAWIYAVLQRPGQFPFLEGKLGEKEWDRSIKICVDIYVDFSYLPGIRVFCIARGESEGD